MDLNNEAEVKETSFGKKYTIWQSQGKKIISIENSTHKDPGIIRLADLREIANKEFKISHSRILIEIYKSTHKTVLLITDGRDFLDEQTRSARKNPK